MTEPGKGWSVPENLHITQTRPQHLGNIGVVSLLEDRILCEGDNGGVLFFVCFEV